ncbi:hypothetical protein TNCV_1160681 [Trichonephila clavipes]|nr:hypothetical protein TNCV_1160681 [Trichonephila clavipes]
MHECQARGSRLLPLEESSRILRAPPVSAVWISRDGDFPLDERGQDFVCSIRDTSGWIVNDDKYDFVRFAGEQFPSSVAGIVRKKPTLLENQNTKQDDDYDDIDNNGSSDNDDDYEDASVFCDTFTE